MQQEKMVKKISVERGEYMRPATEAEKTTKEIEKNFANNDWTRFDSREQIIFKNNTIHLCVY